MLGSVALLAGVAACGSDDPAGPEPDLDPFVGDWEAVGLLVTSLDTPPVTADLIGSGAAFTVNVQPSGQYTAVLTFLGIPQTEIGTLSRDGGELVFRREFPNADVSRSGYAFRGDTLVLDAPTSFDFGLDGTAEEARLESKLLRR